LIASRLALRSVHHDSRRGAQLALRFQRPDHRHSSRAHLTRVSALSSPGTRPGIRPVIRAPLAEEPAISVPVSCCLSATGFGLSGHPVPARELGLPHGRLTGRAAPGPGRGFHVPHQRDTTGMGASSTPGTTMLSWPDAVPGQRLPLPSGQSLSPANCTHRGSTESRGINGGSRDSPARPAPRL
jgi:hypothetical protein